MRFRISGLYRCAKGRENRPEGDQGSCKKRWHGICEGIHALQCLLFCRRSQSRRHVCKMHHLLIGVVAFSPLFTPFQSLAKEIVRSRRTVNRLHENKAQLNSISMHLGESVGTKLWPRNLFSTGLPYGSYMNKQWLNYSRLHLSCASSDSDLGVNLFSVISWRTCALSP